MGGGGGGAHRGAKLATRKCNITEVAVKWLYCRIFLTLKFKGSDLC